MSALGERTLMLLLTDTDSMVEITKEGLPAKVIPTPAFRGVFDWAVAYYQTSNVAPTVEVIHERFGADLFSDNGINMSEDVEETVEWAIEDLKQGYIQMEIGVFSRRLATDVATASPEERVQIAADRSAELNGLILAMQPRTSHVDLRESGAELMAEYDRIVAGRGEIRGMSLGLPMLDAHLSGIWDGELTIMAGPPGTGKSFFADHVAHHEWSRGRATTIYTLENSILMTQMRIACQALKFDILDLQSGNLPEEQVTMLREWCHDVLAKSDTPLNIESPSTSLRSPESIVQMARAYDTESLIIDQLTFMAPVRRLNSRPQEIQEMLHTLKEMISTGRHQMPCLLMHQINREGVKAAAVTGRLEMHHMAEGSEVERTGDHVFSLYAGDEDVHTQQMQIQHLKDRRNPLQDFRVDWEPWTGKVQHADAEVEQTMAAMVDA